MEHYWCQGRPAEAVEMSRKAKWCALGATLVGIAVMLLFVVPALVEAVSQGRVQFEGEQPAGNRG
ncbi:hypothetical protein [Corynebacterium sp. SCR221107]|uniref:hypothetical protein n=1 Tax=Corynebacterium sp. SCR221107 TaxID=3017361 RepID=UPI003FA42326